MIRIAEGQLRFGERILFKDLGFAVPDGGRVGIVGRNGAGKTTLLRVLAGETFLDGGTVEVPPREEIGYLPQDLAELGVAIVSDFLKERAGIASLERELRRLETLIADSSGEDASLLSRYDHVSALFRSRDGFSFEARAAKVLSGLGFGPDALSQPCDAFSGGWKMRLLLASILLAEPKTMLLDEPTNHLDTESMEWLEGYLRDYRGTLVVISHDRRFLDKMTFETAELSLGRITLYRGNYSYYLDESARRKETLEKQARRQETEIQKTEQFIERFRYKATKASQVQSRIRQLEKVERITLEGEAAAAVLRFPPCLRSGFDVVRLSAVSKSYGTHQVFGDVSFTIHRGEKVALVGVNGAGKSTLSRLLAFEEEPTEGTVHRGLNVLPAFFSQESSRNLDYRNTIWQEVTSTGSELSERERRSLLGAFLFSGDDIHKPVSVLSGGEKSRLGLLKVLLRPSNFLVLDEPTNHLDMATKEIFQQALMAYDGTLVIVSHDRHFLDDLAVRIIEIRRGKVHDYHGNYSYFIERRKALLELEGAEAPPSGEAPARSVQTERERKRDEARRRNELYRRRQEVLAELKPLEALIDDMEAEKNRIEETLCDPSVLADSERVGKLMIALDETRKAIESHLPRWESLMERLEAVEAEPL
ncbi:MAG: ABC-F family ATP-binding cassette domain-containing protein [Synergistales bacterium]|nr:ABC-F family ATP-binding cassette domain-containing protein [Synergistales bacterium]